MHVFVTAAPGSSDLLADECRVLGLRAEGVFDDGVALSLDAPQAARALIHLRLADSLLLRVAEVPCPHANRFYHEVRNLNWERWLDPKVTLNISVRGVLPDSDEGRELLAQRGGPPPKPGPPLREPDFAATKIGEAVLDRLHLHLGGRPELVSRDPDVRIVAIFGGDQCTLLLDLAGAPLSRRDHRPEGRCLRPTFAATMAAASGWRGSRPLRLPLDQSGILAIEAVQRALRIAPNSRREFGVERWPNDGERLHGLLEQERERAQAHEVDALARAELDVRICDHDRGVVRTITNNITAVGLADIIKVDRLNARRIPPPPPGTLILANPPEPDRIGQEAAVQLYAALGEHWRTFGGCDAWVFNGSGDFEPEFGHRPVDGRRLFNGKDMVDLLYYRFGRS